MPLLLRLRPVHVGLEGEDGRLVFFGHRLMALVVICEDQTVRLDYGEVPTMQQGHRWPDLKTARTDLLYLAKFYAAGGTPKQIYDLIYRPRP